VATWGYADPDAAGARAFTLFVAGLSNAWSAHDDRVWRKVLKIHFRRVGDQMIQAGPAEWVYRPYEVKSAQGDRSESTHPEPLGKILRITRQGDKVYINLGEADEVRPKRTFTVCGAGPRRANDSPKASVEVLTVLQPHLSLARVTWLRDPDREPLVEGDQLYNPARGPTQGVGHDDNAKKERSRPAGAYNGDRDVQELIHQYRGLSDKDKLGQEGERIRLQLKSLNDAGQVSLSPLARDAIAAVQAEHLLRGDLREAKNKQVMDAVARAVGEARAETLEKLLEQEVKRRSRADTKATQTKRLTFTRDMLPVSAGALAPLLRQMAWDRYHDDRFTVRTAPPSETLTLEGPKEIVDWANSTIETLNKAASKP
jgi:hypothetical protein